ncbi:FecR family protein [Longitalea luteola]|uniref:FecR family protein n=1 Tax=Longitalea luteola TaxID=2812563 RepID=UPI001A967439|nr:FecR family protein [Longitalea luteola]
MPGSNEHFRQLVTDYLNNACTPQQVEELMRLLQQDAANRVVLQLLQAEFIAAMENRDELPVAISVRLRNRLMQSVQPPVTRFYQRLFFRVAAAAILILSLGAGWFFLQKKAPVKEVVRNTAPPVQTTISKKTGAYITLANGEQIEISNAGKDTVISNNNINVIKLADSRIAYYDTSSHSNAEITYHTLTVPRGIKMVQVMLADGSMVWLNTASSLKYPTSFGSHERAVQLTGEAFFDVKHDAGRPFTVRTNNMSVNVLGTSFNVSAYDDDEQSNVVLVKGSVGVSAKGHAGMLTKRLIPGNMASFGPGAEGITVVSVNTDEYVSWRKGYLLFRQTSLQQIIKRVSRYYDANINTNVLAHTDETFSGRLDLQSNIEDIMNLLCLGTPYMYLPKEQKLALKK